MQKIAVVYKSNYGTTQKYARWIAQDTGADLFVCGKIGIDALLAYDAIVYCGALYAGGMLGFKFIKRNFEKLKQKRLIVVAVGATLKKAEEIPDVRDHNLSPEMRDVPFYLLRGGLDYKKMCAIHRIMLYLLVKKAKSMDPEKLDSDAKGMIATYGKTVDFTNKKAIEPIVEELHRA